ncbi:Calmodulin [Frankliniella fusca]|uniref:Calmodulin n=1 Tax=Frankliniella fusca TaxID=407009 RepID=A0AAE1LJE6_9NEOP|nr:Calmodulin [Frankliniella fusca]
MDAVVGQAREGRGARVEDEWQGEGAPAPAPPENDGPQEPEQEEEVEEETYEYSEEQVREMRQAFKKYDEFNTDSIPVGKLGPVLRALVLNPTERQLIEARRWLDADPVNGVVRFREFLIIMGRCLKDPVTVEHVLDGFRRLDEKHEGVVDKQRLREVLTATGEKFMPYEFTIFMKYADPRRKGRVKYEDFVRKMNSGLIKVKRKRRRRKKGKKKKKKSKGKKDRESYMSSVDDMTLSSELSIG